MTEEPAQPAQEAHHSMGQRDKPNTNNEMVPSRFPSWYRPKPAHFPEKPAQCPAETGTPLLGDDHEDAVPATPSGDAVPVSDAPCAGTVPVLDGNMEPQALRNQCAESDVPVVPVADTPMENRGEEKRKGARPSVSGFVHSNKTQRRHRSC